MIPTIIHQTWKTKTIPPEWESFRRSWQKHHPAWEFRLWTDADNLDFINRYFPAFLALYQGYSNAICRADVIRYFLLKQFGGIYVDLDFECTQPLDPLLNGREILLGLEPETHVQNHYHSSGLSFITCNALIASRPGHPFWDHVIKCLSAESHRPDPLDATGPFFLTRAFMTYKPCEQQITILPSALIYPADARDCHKGRLFDPEKWLHLTARAYAVYHWAGSWYRSPSSHETLPCAEARGRLMVRGKVAADTLFHVQAISNPHPSPLVSCLMVTRNRPIQAICAIQCFQHQTYPEREMIILDDSEDQTLEVWVNQQNDNRLRYYSLPPDSAELGSLRNRAVALARGKYVCQWDDDDLYDPARIETQLGLMLAAGADACLLSRWMIWWPRQERFAVSNFRVWEGSIICAKQNMTPYPDKMARGEDTAVTTELLKSSRVLLLDLPRLYLYVVHGKNTFDDDHFDEHWQASNPRFEGSIYWRLYQEISRRMDLDSALSAIRPESSARAKTPNAEKTGQPQIDSPEASIPVTSSALILGRKNIHAATNEWPSVLILTPIKNAASLLPKFFDNLLRVKYPLDQLSLGFVESDSDDDSWNILHELSASHAEHFARITKFQMHFGLRIAGDRWAPEIQFNRRKVLAKCRNALFRSAYKQEAWVLWLDADVIDYPSDALSRLLSTGKSIVVPHCVQKFGGSSFDLNTFKYTPGAVANSWVHALDGIIQPLPGRKRHYLDALRSKELIEVDSVGGTMLLVRSDLHASGILFPDYSYRGYIETEGFAMLARDNGFSCWGMPGLEIQHAAY